MTALEIWQILLGAFHGTNSSLYHFLWDWDWSTQNWVYPLWDVLQGAWHLCKPGLPYPMHPMDWRAGIEWTMFKVWISGTEGASRTMGGCGARDRCISRPQSISTLPDVLSTSALTSGLGWECLLPALLCRMSKNIYLLPMPVNIYQFTFLIYAFQVRSSFHSFYYYSPWRSLQANYWQVMKFSTYRLKCRDCMDKIIMLVIIKTASFAFLCSSQNNSPVQILICCEIKSVIYSIGYGEQTCTGQLSLAINKLEWLCLLTGSLLLSCGVLLSALRNPLGNSTDLFCFNKLEQLELCTLHFSDAIATPQGSLSCPAPQGCVGDVLGEVK